MFTSVFEIPQAPFPFEFESELSNGNLETKQSLNYHLAIQLTFPNLMNGNLMTVLSPNCHSAVQTQTQTQTEPEVYGMHVYKTKYLEGKGSQLGKHGFGSLHNLSCTAKDTGAHPASTLTSLHK